MTISQEQTLDYESKFAVLSKGFGTDQSLNDFLMNPKPVLEKAGIPLLEPADITESLSGSEDAPTKSIEVKWKWYGVDIIMDESTTQMIIDSTTDIGQISAGLSACLPPPANVAVAAGLAIAFFAKVWEIKLVDKKQTGVHWIITWLQWAPLIASASMGPGSIAVAAEVFIHPTAN
ncbi:hypothetical protein [Methyloglobulus sp.]|uniref:hypothetical protein n=1 Tax=Methyloglobulus sp. TaxID=2518622 RepID=UPI00182C2196|nr:hypothetical protein [Methyloglobulus sp.]